jgi:hypothetical protein
VRIGVSASYAEPFVRALELVPEVRDHSSICCDRSDELAKLLNENYVDVAFLQLPHEPREIVVAQWMQNYVSVRSHGFAMSPSAPLPIVGHIGDISSAVARAIPVGICIRNYAPRVGIAPVIRIFESMMGQMGDLAETATVPALLR